ncbi:MAG: hypothetical protein V4649_05265 [Bacteroidota bacterium]
MIKYPRIDKRLLCPLIAFFLFGCSNSDLAKKPVTIPNAAMEGDTTAKAAPAAAAPAQVATTLDTALYNKSLKHMVHDSVSARWPVKTAYPTAGAILPMNRIIAYYGNFYSKGMGILGELPEDEMLAKLKGEVKKWEAADPATPVVPAIHYICITAQGQPGQAGKYRMRMPFTQIDKALEIAKKINAIVFLDVQIGWSTVQEEVSTLEQYLKLPNVHLGVDPEFSMKVQKRPGTIIGTLDAADINWITGYLAKLAKENNLPPKVLVIHRFTRGMVTNYKQIVTRPEVQIVMHMDGWGFPAKKVSSYQIAEQTEPVQFTGFKLFYKNDIKTPPWKTIMTPEQVLKLYPMPVYIQYQ